MWSDNETKTDLLGFRIHARLIRSVVTDTTLLPTTIGVFGDWGSGKSSVMKMLEEELQDEESIATIYFNGWQFEGYDEAKTVLIQTILVELAENKTFGESVKEQAKKLIGRVDWLRLANMGYQISAPLITAWLSGKTGAQTFPLPATLPMKPEFENGDKEEPDKSIEEMDITEFLENNPSQQGFLGAREFRNEFQDLIDKTDLESLVILVDDLDRCEPKRLVETLEAIKLFLSVPHVAFVIGADERIVRSAIAKRYEIGIYEPENTPGETGLDLITDYLEKLIQVPYHLPRLSQSEVETLMTLLFCKKHLGDSFADIHHAYVESRKEDITKIFDFQQIRDVAESKDIPLPDELLRELTWCNNIAPAMSDILKGNPRQTKRLLNAIELRRKLAESANLENISDQILVKLMLLEYIRPRLFSQLYRWQSSQNGTPREIELLERWASSEDEVTNEELENQVDRSSRWISSNIRRWLSIPPELSGVDLRNYFWVTRDRLQGILSGASMMPRQLREIIYDLSELEAEGIFPEELRDRVRQLQADEQAILLDELGSKLLRMEDKQDIIWVWEQLLSLIPNAPHRLLDLLEKLQPGNLPTNTPLKVARIGGDHGRVLPRCEELLQTWAQEKESPFGTAAEIALEKL